MLILNEDKGLVRSVAVIKMGCDIIKRACAIQMLVICFGLHNSASLSVPSSSVMKSSSGSGGHQLALTRNRRYRRRAYADYSDDVVSFADLWIKIVIAMDRL